MKSISAVGNKDLVAHMQGSWSGDCQIMARVLNRIGDKWSVLVIMLLGEKPMRFNEIRRIIDGISQRMLTLTDREAGDK